MNKTKIEWVKNPDGKQGYTWNVITGCLNGSPYCYARKLAKTRLRERYLANKNVAPYKDERDYMRNRHNPFYPRFWEDRLEQVLKAPKNSGIFPCDMSDLFGIGIPYWWTKSILDMILLRPDCRFYLLTKQPQNLIKFSPFPDNCWVGVSVTDRQMWGNANLYLANVQAKVKYLSFEPLLGDIVGQINTSFVTFALKETVGIDWVIIGSQTKPYKPPEWEWVSEIIDACVDAGIPYFLKDNLEKVVPKGLYGGKLIQELPDV